MRILLIGNPVSGRGRAPRSIAVLVERLESRGHEVEVFLTAGIGDARSRAATLGEGVERLVVVGGDGTLNEVINGLADPSRVPIVQLPMGTANILARELGFARTPDGIADLIETGSVRRIDLGVVDGRRFVSVLGVGFDAAVIHKIHLNRRGSLGFRGYVVPVLRALAEYAAPSLSVQVDDQLPVNGSLAVVSNIRNYGGLFEITDRALCDSGWLDVAVFHRGSIPAMIAYGLGAFLGRLSRRKDLTYLTGLRVRIDSAKPVPVQVDGDYYGETPLDIRALPGALPVVVRLRDPGHERSGRAAIRSRGFFTRQ